MLWNQAVWSEGPWTARAFKVVSSLCPSRPVTKERRAPLGPEMEERACRSRSQLRQPALCTRSFSKNPGHPSYRRAQSDGVEGEWAPTAPIYRLTGPRKAGGRNRRPDPPGSAHGWLRPAEAPRPARCSEAPPWRCASGLLAGALCSGLACCFSGIPSPRYPLHPRLRLRVSGGPGAVSSRALRAVHLRGLVWTFRVPETASFQEDFRWLGVRRGARRV